MTTTPPPPPPPGWYPAPDDAATEQWWTGRDWGTARRSRQAVPNAVAVVARKPARRGLGFAALVSVLLGVLVVVFVVQVLTHLNPSVASGGAGTGQNLQSTNRQVTYLVTGSAAGASVTLQTPSGTQQHDVRLPMEASDGSDFGFSADIGQFVYVAAQNSGDSGDVTCTITVDGKTVAKNTSTAAYGIAECNATVQ